MRYLSWRTPRKTANVEYHSGRGRRSPEEEVTYETARSRAFGRIRAAPAFQHTEPARHDGVRRAARVRRHRVFHRDHGRARRHVRGRGRAVLAPYQRTAFAASHGNRRRRFGSGRVRPGGRPVGSRARARGVSGSSLHRLRAGAAQPHVALGASAARVPAEAICTSWEATRGPPRCARSC